MPMTASPKGQSWHDRFDSHELIRGPGYSATLPFIQQPHAKPGLQTPRQSGFLSAAAFLSQSLLCVLALKSACQVESLRIAKLALMRAW